MRIAVIFENHLRATWASQALRGSGTLGSTDTVTLGLGCAILMTFALEGMTLLAVVTATALALAWGALYGVLASTLSTPAVPRPLDLSRPLDLPPRQSIVVVDSSSPESISRARRYLMACAGAMVARSG